MATNSLSIKTSQGQRDANPSPVRRSQDARGVNNAPPWINTNTAPSSHAGSANGTTATPSLNTRGSQSLTLIPTTTPTPSTATTIIPPNSASAHSQLSLNKSTARLTRRDTPSALKDADDGTAKGSPTNPVQPNPPSHLATTPINPGVDPLSQHIFARTNTESSVIRQSRIRNSIVNRPDSPGSGFEPLPRQGSDLNGRQTAGAGDAGKAKKYVHVQCCPFRGSVGGAGTRASL